MNVLRKPHILQTLTKRWKKSHLHLLNRNSMWLNDSSRWEKINFRQKTRWQSNLKKKIFLKDILGKNFNYLWHRDQVRCIGKLASLYRWLLWLVLFELIANFAKCLQYHTACEFLSSLLPLVGCHESLLRRNPNWFLHFSEKFKWQCK